MQQIKILCNFSVHHFSWYSYELSPERLFVLSCRLFYVRQHFVASLLVPPSPSSLHSLFSETLLCLCVAVADTVQWLSVAGCQQGQRTGCPALCCTIISVPTRCAPFWLCCFSLFVSLFQLRCYWHGSNEKTELCKLTLKDEGILKRPESLWKSSIKCGTNLPPRYCNE